MVVYRGLLATCHQIKHLANRGCCRGHQPAATGAALLVVGNFNTNLDVKEGRERNEGIEASMAEEGLEDMSRHFLPQRKPWLKDDQTRAMNRGGWDA